MRLLNALADFQSIWQTCEDYYFTGKVAEIGKLVYSSSTQYIHLGEDRSYSQLFRKEIWRAKSNLASVKGRRIPLREIPSFVVPTAIVVLFLGALLLFSLNMPLWAMASLVLAGIPFVAYTARLYALARHYGVSLMECGYFYASYFTARSVGTVSGLIQRVFSS